MRVDPLIKGISGLVKENQRFPRPSHHMRTQQRQPSLNQEVGPHQTLTLSVP